MRRACVGAAIAALVVLGTASPASAHTLSGAPPTNYRTEITSVDPRPDGVQVRMRNLGRQVELRNDGDEDVIVLGYNGEPYLRVGPDGVFENLRSPTTYANRPDSPVPPDSVDVAAEPDWDRTSEGHTARWRDRRTRWEGTDPPQVATQPDAVHVVVPSWVIEVRQGDTVIKVTGRILYVPPSSTGPWIALAVVVGLAAVAAGSSRQWMVLLGGTLAVLLAVDVVHSAGLAAFDASGTGEVLARLLARNTVAPVVWALGVWAVAGVQRGEDRAVLVAIGVAVVIGLVGGLSDLASLTRSQLPFAYAPATARAAVALSLGLGFGVAAGGAIALRKHLPVRAGPARPAGVPSRPAGVPPRPSSRGRPPPKRRPSAARRRS